jgi:hypothetical protein
MAFPLPRRHGPGPRITPTNPHTQLDQQPAAGEAEKVRAGLASLVFALPDVRERPSAVSVPGARALATRDDREVEIVSELVRAGHAFGRGTVGVSDVSNQEA